MLLHYFVSAKQALNDKLQGSVAAYLRCGGVVNHQLKRGLLPSLWVKKNLIGEYLAKLPAKTWLSRALSSSFSSTLYVGQARKVHETTIRSCLQLCRIFTDFKNLSRKLPVKKFCKSVKIWQSWSWVCGPAFSAHAPCRSVSSVARCRRSRRQEDRRRRNVDRQENDDSVNAAAGR